ncbi:uncharacterized protein AB9X84_014472 isoform 1-T1 [Acanthopagrus schlegelii]
MCLWISTPALRFGSEILTCTGKTEEDTLNVPQDLPHRNPALLHPVVQHHLVEGVEAMGMDLVLDLIMDMGMDMIMDMDMDMIMDMIMDMDMDMIMDMAITDMDMAITDMDTIMDIMVITDMDMVITDMDTIMDMVITDMDTIMDMDMVATGTGTVTCIAIVIRKAGSVMGPPAAPAAATLTR